MNVRYDKVLNVHNSKYNAKYKYKISKGVPNLYFCPVLKGYEPNGKTQCQR